MPTDDTNFEDELRALMAAGRKIEAIKLYRERTAVGLKEAKDFIDALAADQDIVTPSKSGCLGVVLLILIPLAAFAFGCAQGGQKIRRPGSRPWPTPWPSSSPSSSSI